MKNRERLLISDCSRELYSEIDTEKLHLPSRT